MADATRIAVGGPVPYPVLVGQHLLGELAPLLAGATQVAVIHPVPLRAVAGEACERLAAAGFAAHAIEVPDGEDAKTLAVAGTCWDELGRLGMTRSDAIVGIGGGACTDLAGWVAAAWLRGVRVVQVATSLAGMVDAAVGGKTGINVERGKNLVGAFHPPAGVLCDLALLATLPAGDYRAGLAEVVKCGFIADPELLRILEQLPVQPAGDDAALPLVVAAELVARAVRVKAEVVAEDETESGRRAILNFGHTVGHALEAASSYGLLHGEAVGLGMLAALSLGEARGLGTPALTARATALLARLGLPVDLESRLSAEVLARISVDKKRRGGAIKFVFCPKPGETRLVEVSPDEIAAHFLAGARKPARP
jgi:3-dehydroquinate synthase